MRVRRSDERGRQRRRRKKSQACQDSTALEDLQALNLFATPVLKIGDEVIVGFDRKAMDRELGKAGS